MPLKAVEHAEDIFQSTLPREERLIFRFLVLLILLYFNPRSHERSDCVSTCSTCFSTTYFNPRSHERSDIAKETYRPALFISIHAPTRGATMRSVTQKCINCISIHAPTRGATKNPQAVANNSNISIHAPTRGATVVITVLTTSIKISIHAPTRGATRHTHI